ncbi:MAG: four-carbon acid sugar kinase family protein [Candidatus Korobacteraceae bacterium]
MPRILIVADDLSGAADSAVTSASCGLKTVVLIGLPPEQAPASNSLRELSLVDALAIDADTRSFPPTEAAEETARVLRACYRPGDLVFKKLDSTLRGNLAAELSAVLRVAGELGHHHGAAHPVAIVAPAFPAMGRTTRNGLQYVNGVPLEETEIWRREGTGANANIPALLEVAGIRATGISLELVRMEQTRLADELRERATHHQALVCDAETEDDLRSIAAASLVLERRTIWAGSAGLARCLFPAALSEAMFNQDSRRAMEPAQPSLPPVEGPILFVVGSAASVSREQARRLAADHVALIEIPTAVLLGGEMSTDWQEHVSRLSAALAAGRDTVLLLGGSQDPVRGEYSHPLSQALARMVAAHSQAIHALVVTGGETARAVLLALGVRGLSILYEIEPGVPLAITHDALALPVITKAGAFGNQETLLRCRVALRASSLHNR